LIKPAVLPLNTLRFLNFHKNRLHGNVSSLIIAAAMNRCDWIGCSAIGLFDGIDSSLLNSEGRKNVPFDENRSRFIYLCPEHFELGVGNFNANEDVRK